MKHLINDGSLSRIWEINAHFDRYQPEPSIPWCGELTIASAGSVVYELGTQLIDQVYSLFVMPSTVKARMWSHAEGTVDFERPDAFSAELVYSPDLSANIRIRSHGAEAVQPRFRVRGTNESYFKSGLDPQENQLSACMDPSDIRYGAEEPERSKLIAVRDGLPEERAVPGLKPQTYLEFCRQFQVALSSGCAGDNPVTAL